MTGLFRLRAALAVYFTASLLHFVHNATFVREYPNLPASLTAANIYLAWCAITALGCGGYLLYRRGREKWGLALLAIYASLGFGGFDHYVVAPMSAHSLAMNFTIFFEAVAAAVLLCVLGLTLFESRRAQS